MRLPRRITVVAATMLTGALIAPAAAGTVAPGGGSNPDALTVSHDGRALYVANAGNNDVAVIDLGSGCVRGLIPTAWYPTALVATERALFITNGKGQGAGPNNGPGHPTRKTPTPRPRASTPAR